MKMEAEQTNTTVSDKTKKNKTLLQIIYTYIKIKVVPVHAYRNRGMAPLILNLRRH